MLSQSGPLVNQVPLQVMSPNDPGEPTGVQIYDGVSRPVPNAMEIDGGSHIHFGLSQAAMQNTTNVLEMHQQNLVLPGASVNEYTSLFERYTELQAHFLSYEGRVERYCSELEQNEVQKAKSAMYEHHQAFREEARQHELVARQAMRSEVQIACQRTHASLNAEVEKSSMLRVEAQQEAVSYTHLTLPTTPYV